MSLKNSAMLVKMTIKQWDPYKRDKRATESVDATFNTDGKSGNFNKALLDKKILRPVTTVLSNIRTEHNRLTMPWTYRGVSILPSSLFLEYTSVMRELDPMLKQAVQNLVDQMPVHLANQRTKLGNLFDMNDYPSRYELLNAYSVTHSFFPVPEANHFVIDLAEAEMTKIKQDLQNDLSIATDEAINSLYDRIRKIVFDVYERLSDPDKIFRDSLINNVRELVEVLPKFNVFNNERIDDLCQEITKKLLIAEPQDLRDNLDTRREVAQNAYDIISLLNGPKTERIAA